MVFILILRPVVRNVQSGNAFAARPFLLLLTLALLALIAWIWVGALIDQMPCFLGVPNCD
jgi:hypothetical protein